MCLLQNRKTKRKKNIYEFRREIEKKNEMKMN